jgi:8-amino-7-oxononanoate synthase
MSEPLELLRQLETEGLLRQLRPLDGGTGPQVSRAGRPLWNFASNDYLGLARHPQVEEAFVGGIRRHGAGAAASRLVCGTLPSHRQLEEALAEAKQSAAALTFSSGFAAATGLIPAITGRDDVVILDKLCHASLADAARLSKATLRVFPHNDVGKLARLLTSVRRRHPASRILVVTESVFSMDGDVCPLAEIVALTESAGALLLLDEAHAIGVRGETGMGLAEELGLQQRITFQMGTLSKALGLAGGYIAASRPWIDLLVNRARPFIFSTAPPPGLADAALAALGIVRSAEGAALRARLRENIAGFCDAAGLPPAPSPIIPVVTGDNASAVAAAAALDDCGFLVPPIRYPAVPRGGARLRVSLSAAQPLEIVRSLGTAISGLSKSFPLR